MYAILAGLMLSSGANAYNETYQHDIQKEILASFEVPKIETMPPVQKKSHLEKVYGYVRQLLTIPVFPDPSITPLDRLKLAFRYPTSYQPDHNPVVDLELINKLEVLRGVKDISENLIRRITSFDDGTTIQAFLLTTAGLKTMSELISMPTTDIPIVKRRQSIIKIFTKNDSLRNNLSSLLKKIQSAEAYVYEFQKGYEDERFSLLGLVGLDKSVIISNLSYLYSLAEPLYQLLGPPLLVRSNIKKLNEGYLAYYKKELEGEVPPEILEEQAKKYFEEFKKHPNYKDRVKEEYITGAIRSSIITPLILWELYEIKKGRAQIYDTYKRLIQAATYIRSAQKLIRILASDPEISVAMPEIKEKMIAYSDNTAGSKDFQKLLKNLNSSTFDGPKPLLTTTPGAIFATHGLIKRGTEVWADIADLFDFIGKLDVYVAIAQKIKAHEKLNAQLSFVEFDQKSIYPFIKAVGLWNPFIPPHEAIPNDFNLNTGNERGVLLTGPNTSGKTTFIKAVMDSLILAQTFGIAPAQSMTITPFARLLSYMNITDDVSAGISQFKAETLRAQELKNRILGLASNEFSFLILDEIFTGTDPEHAEMLAHIFLKNLSNFTNVLFINATHFKKLAELEEETKGIIKSYYLDAVINKEGRVIKYTRKLVPGVAKYSSAQQVAEESGIADDWGSQKAKQ